METKDFDPVAASGEGTYRSPEALKLNDILINGDAEADEVDGKLVRKGGYFRKRMLVGNPKDQKPEEINLGSPVSIVVVKIRRRLIQRGEKGKTLYVTNEHNTKHDKVELRDENFQIIDVAHAEAIRERFPGLRTEQVLYALHQMTPGSEPELVRVRVKGASLGSESKDKATTDFYDYFKVFGKGEHIWQYQTELHAILEKGQKSYFCIDFKRGARLSDKFEQLAVENMKTVVENCAELQAHREQQWAERAAKLGQVAVVTAAAVETKPDEFDKALDAAWDGVAAPAPAAAEINPEDIPF